MEEIKSQTRLQLMLDDWKKSPLIGLEYVVEIVRSEGQDPLYCCMLCNKNCIPGVTIAHLTSFMHHNKYLIAHFPSVNKEMEDRFPKTKPGRKRISKVVARIEHELGRLSPIYVEKEENFEENKESIRKKILGDNHLRETPSLSFTDIFEETDDNEADAEIENMEEQKPVVRPMSHLEAVLENHKNNPIVGLNYIIEIGSENEEDEHTYFCALCEKQGDPRVTVSHLISMNHRQKFIAQCFPKTERLLVSKYKHEKREMIKARKLICTKIEEQHGRPSPTVVDKAMFEKYKYKIINDILENKRFCSRTDRENDNMFIDLINSQMMYFLPMQLGDDPDFASDSTFVNLINFGIKTEVEDVKNEKTQPDNARPYRICKKKTDVEAILKDLGGPTVGTEYLIELTSEMPNREPAYLCALCEKRGDPRVAVAHFTSYKHCAKYINLFFPAAKKAILLTLGTKRECKKGISEMIMILCRAIQEKYECLCPRSYDENYFEKNRKAIMDEIINGKHLRETPEVNFVEFVEKESTAVSYVSNMDYNGGLAIGIADPSSENIVSEVAEQISIPSTSLTHYVTLEVPSRSAGKRKLDKYETEDTIGISLNEIQRRVMLKQLSVLAMQEENSKLQNELLNLKKQKLMWEKEQRE